MIEGATTTIEHLATHLVSCGCRLLLLLCHAPHDRPDRLVAHPVLGCQLAQALVLSTLGDLRPEGRINLRPVLRRGPQRDVTLHREVGDGRQFVLAGSTPITPAP